MKLFIGFDEKVELTLCSLEEKIQKRITAADMIPDKEYIESLALRVYGKLCKMRKENITIPELERAMDIIFIQYGMEELAACYAVDHKDTYNNEHPAETSLEEDGVTAEEDHDEDIIAHDSVVDETEVPLADMPAADEVIEEEHFEETVCANNDLPAFDESDIPMMDEDLTLPEFEVPLVEETSDAGKQLELKVADTSRQIQDAIVAAEEKIQNSDNFDIPLMEEDKAEKQPAEEVMIEDNSEEETFESIELPAEEVVEKKSYLFLTKKCPNGEKAVELVKTLKEKPEIIEVTTKEAMELCKELGVTEAPTLVVVEGEKVTKYVSTKKIREYVRSTR